MARSIHLGNVLRRDRRIEERLAAMEPAWTVLRFGRKHLDGSPEKLIAEVKASLG